MEDKEKQKLSKLILGCVCVGVVACLVIGLSFYKDKEKNKETENTTKLEEPLATVPNAGDTQQKQEKLDAPKEEEKVEYIEMPKEVVGKVGADFKVEDYLLDNPNVTEVYLTEDGIGLEISEANKGLVVRDKERNIEIWSRSIGGVTEVKYKKGGKLEVTVDSTVWSEYSWSTQKDKILRELRELAYIKEGVVVDGEIQIIEKMEN